MDYSNLLKPNGTPQKSKIQHAYTGRVSRDPVGDFTEKVKMGRAKEGGTKRQYSSDALATKTFVRADEHKAYAKKEWKNFMTNMPKGHITKADIQAKRKEIWKKQWE
jgi:hypothetical protein